MNWRWILMLSLLGVAMGVAGVFGWLEGFELWVWIGLMLITAVLIGYNLPAKHFQHGLLIATFWAVINGAVQYFFYDTYIAHNPAAAEKMAQLPEGFDPRTAMLISIPFSLIISGLILGLLSLLAGKLLREKPAPETITTGEAEPHDTTGQ